MLEGGFSIICSRYAYSGVAYSNAKGLNLDWCKSVDSGLVRPDLIVYLDVDPVELSKRSGFGDEVYEKLDFQTKVQKSFREVLKNEDNVIVIDGTKKPEVIHDEICNAYKNIKVNEIGKLWMK